MRQFYEFRLHILAVSLLFFLLFVILFPSFSFSSIIAGIAFAILTQQLSLGFWHYSKVFKPMVLAATTALFYIFKFILIAMIITLVNFFTIIEIIPFLVSFLIIITILLFVTGAFYGKNLFNNLNKEGG